MRLLNCRLDELPDRLKGQKLILFGVGEYWELYMKEMLTAEVADSVAYVIDNGRFGAEFQIMGNKVPIYHPSKLLEEDSCVVVLSSGIYLKEMYEQLQEMNLSDGISCYAFQLIMANSVGKSDTQIWEHIAQRQESPQIEKIIHCFWFSGEQKPEAYQKCVNSWKKICPDYEIREWNTDNYDYTKNKFMKQAVEQKKWAFASDYARLDVVYHQGGIYLDMDVELLQPMDCLLGCDAFFSFDTQNDIDLGTFAAKPGNPLVKKLKELYDDIEFSADVQIMNRLCQPRYIRSVLREAGLILNGNLQMIDGMAFLPRNYFVPLDCVLYELSAMTEETLAIHHFNAGWRNDDYRMKRIKNNRKLWSLIEK